MRMVLSVSWRGIMKMIDGLGWFPGGGWGGRETCHSPLLHIIPVLNNPGRIRAQTSMSTFSQNTYPVIDLPFLGLQCTSQNTAIQFFYPNPLCTTVQLALCSMPSLPISTPVSTRQPLPCVSSSAVNSADTQDMLCVLCTDLYDVPL